MNECIYVRFWVQKIKNYNVQYVHKNSKMFILPSQRNYV